MSMPKPHIFMPAIMAFAHGLPIQFKKANGDWTLWNPQVDERLSPDFGNPAFAWRPQPAMAYQWLVQRSGEAPFVTSMRFTGTGIVEDAKQKGYTILRRIEETAVEM